MPWPVDDISTGDLDSGSDTPPRTTFFRMATVLKSIIANRGAAGGIASLDANSKVPDTQIGRGSANGVASLGANGKVPAAQLPPTAPAPTGVVSGMLVAFGGTVVPNGWLECNGAAVSRTTHAALFTAIGTTWGAGDGATTFNLPDLRGRVAMGRNATRAIAATGGSDTHTLTVDEMPAHGHGIEALKIKRWAGADPGDGPKESRSGVDTIRTTSFRVPQPPLETYPALAGTIGIKGGGAAHNNLQPYAVTMVLIKT